MKCQGLWYGGSNYATPSENDAEPFLSIKDAADTLYARADNMDGRTPCVEESEMLLFFGPTVTDYPDMRIYFGPRGGIRRERC